MVTFLVNLTFSDGIPATVCGFCRRDRETAITTALKSLETNAFGSLKEGMLIDHRFIRLLREALEPERDNLYLLGGSIRVAGADTPCGAVLGNPFARTRSAREDLSSIVLPNGKALRLILRPGQGGAVFSCADSGAEEKLYPLLNQTFPSPQTLELLKQESQICLYALDYAPCDFLLNGSCFAQLKNNHPERR